VKNGVGGFDPDIVWLVMMAALFLLSQTVLIVA